MNNLNNIDTNWAEVARFFEAVLSEGEAVQVIVASTVIGDEMSVTIPAFKVEEFMKHLPTFNAEVRPYGTDSSERG